MKYLGPILGVICGANALRRDFYWMNDAPTHGYSVVEIYQREDPSFI